MKTESDRLESLARAVANAVPDFDERIALETYRRLAEGTPAQASDIAKRAGAPTGRVEELLSSWPGVYLDEAKDVVGFWGLAITELSPTHRLEVNGRDLFAWCAWDTLFLPGILDATARVESTCPTTGETISLVVSPRGVVETSHSDAVVSFLMPDRDFDADVIQSFCHFVHFFASREAGETWTAEHAWTFTLPLDDAFELGRRVNALNFPSALGGGR
ncbi:MAG: alkylmercury lyase [Actinobacteria bacterium]|nr:alkylmercury lyase [Actinomycetota bacterium]